MQKQRVTEAVIIAACDHLANVLIAKNRDYGNSVEERFNEDGPRSLFMRLNDKHKRLDIITNGKQKTFDNGEVNPFSITQNVKDETVADTFLDTSGYGILGFILTMPESQLEVMEDHIKAKEVCVPTEVINPKKANTIIETIRDFASNFYDERYAIEELSEVYMTVEKVNKMKEERLQQKREDLKRKMKNLNINTLHEDEVEELLKFLNSPSKWGDVEVSKVDEF